MPGNKSRTGFWWIIKDQNWVGNLDTSTEFSAPDYRRIKAKVIYWPKNILQFNNINVEDPFWFWLFFQLTFSNQNFLSIRFLTGLICIVSEAIKISGTHRQHRPSLLNGKIPWRLIKGRLLPLAAKDSGAKEMHRKAKVVFYPSGPEERLREE